MPFQVESYLHESTMEKIQELCDREWIQMHYKTLIYMENSGCLDVSDGTS